MTIHRLARDEKAGHASGKAAIRDNEAFTSAANSKPKPGHCSLQYATASVNSDSAHERMSIFTAC